MAADSAAADALYQAGTAAYGRGDLEEADRRLGEFRTTAKASERYWAASLLWARSTRDAATAQARLTEVAAGAPPATKAACELELAHLAMLGEHWDAAGDAYAAWLEAHPDDPRADEAAFYRGVCLKTAGKAEEAEEALAALAARARQELWRGQAALLVGAIKSERDDKPGAFAVYRDLAAAPWAADVRPQALLGAGRSAPGPKLWRANLTELLTRYPGTPEAAEAAADLKLPRPAAPRYGIQVGAYGRKSGADGEVKLWKARGRNMVIVRRPGMGLSLYCVVIGPYATREQAEADAAALKARGGAALIIAY